MKKDPLGKGLSAILQDIEERGTTRLISLDQIVPNPSQPRIDMNEETLAELASSVKEKGVLQPILVKRKGRGYEIIAGERRYRAARIAGLVDIPAIIKDVDDKEALELSLIENLQRENLNSLEIATTYERFIEDFGYTQQSLAKRLGIDRSSVANYIRLLKLPDWIKDLLAQGKLTQGHARALLSLKGEKEQKRFIDKIIGSGLSVREVEKAAKLARSEKRSPYLALENSFAERFQTRVTITHKSSKGKIIIEFYSKEDLQRIADIISGRK